MFVGIYYWWPRGVAALHKTMSNDPRALIQLGILNFTELFLILSNHRKTAHWTCSVQRAFCKVGSQRTSYLETWFYRVLGYSMEIFNYCPTGRWYATDLHKITFNYSGVDTALHFWLISMYFWSIGFLQRVKMLLFSQRSMWYKVKYSMILILRRTLSNSIGFIKSFKEHLIFIR